MYSPGFLNASHLDVLRHVVLCRVVLERNLRSHFCCNTIDYLHSIAHIRISAKCPHLAETVVVVPPQKPLS